MACVLFTPALAANTSNIMRYAKQQFDFFCKDIPILGAAFFVNFVNLLLSINVYCAPSELG